ncbi:pyridoxal-phosphate dependent enzyme [Glycomyces sp. L485]|uniref:PLP-dependent cysteine synthase family protein n=1 Tax=Glycomyces sp. L485 TaxID=2909235 RepID=UPI001F4BA8E5|nr:pyridoxal-phosphate dependent enzyme [Glycomyces sp. L485]MCH7232996.1 pyridoxal-phosphate dependent enzyme [Glycomyces sp. L485]
MAERFHSDWARTAIAALREDAASVSVTPLRRDIERFGESIRIHLKDESAQPTGSLKHRLVRDLLLHGLVSGDIREGTTVVEATGGGAAVSLGYFAQMLVLPFVAVMPARTHPAQVEAIERFGGRCELVDPPLAIYETAARIAEEQGGHYLDMFGRAEAATDWRAGNVTGEVLAQCETEPRWIVCGAGTGITSATAGRHLRYVGADTQVAVADPENSSYFPSWATGYAGYATGMPSRIPGIGRPRVEPAFNAEIVDAVVPVPDAASVAAMRYLAERRGAEFGPSTGTCFWAAMELASGMQSEGVAGDLVVVAGDGKQSYRSSFYDDAWLSAKGFDIEPHLRVLEEFAASGRWTI